MQRWWAMGSYAAYVWSVYVAFLLLLSGWGVYLAVLRRRVRQHLDHSGD